MIGSEPTLLSVTVNTIVIPSIIQIVVNSLTVLLRFAYTVLIIIRPIFRQNKLNWFTVNICLQSAAFCIFILPLTCEAIFDISSPLPCRIQAYLIIMAISQVLDSHCVASLCRLMALAYATKTLFRSSVFTWICMRVRVAGFDSGCWSVHLIRSLRMSR